MKTRATTLERRESKKNKRTKYKQKTKAKIYFTSIET